MLSRWRGCRLPHEAEWGLPQMEKPDSRNLLPKPEAASTIASGGGLDQLFEVLLGVDGKPAHTGFSGYKPLPGCRQNITASLCPAR